MRAHSLSLTLSSEEPWALVYKDATLLHAQSREHVARPRIPKRCGHKYDAFKCLFEPSVWAGSVFTSF